MSRLPIRARLTAAFALAMALMLTGTALFVYLRLRADLDERLDAELRARVVAALPAAAPGESVTQVIASDGRVLGQGAALVETVSGERRFERTVAGIEGRARVLAVRRPDGSVVVSAQSLDDRDEALAELLAAFAVGGAVAVALASLVGYALASAGLAPVEAMRRRAAELSPAGAERLPLPAAQDEIRRLGETLNAMVDRLRASYERERRFVADAGHELRTPVAVIKTELEGALRALPAGEVSDAVGAALEECEHLARLADDLLLAAREGEIPLRREPLDARALLERVRERFADRAARQGRALVVEAERVALEGDPVRLGQALGNLVDNALRHGAGEIRLAASAADGAVVLAVSDAGEGVAPELAGHAFERFARGDAARGQRGAGLGLAIVRAIARAHGGDAELDGATVRLRLPAHAALI